MRPLFCLLAASLSASASLIPVEFSGTWDHLCRDSPYVYPPTCNTSAGPISVGASFSGSFLYEEFPALNTNRTISGAEWDTTPNATFLYQMSWPIMWQSTVSYDAQGNFSSALLVARSSGYSMTCCSENPGSGPTLYLLTLTVNSASVRCKDDWQVLWTNAYARDVYVGVNDDELAKSAITPTPEPQMLWLVLAVGLFICKWRRQ